MTPCPNIKGIDAKIAKKAPLEFIKIIEKINKIDKTKTMKNFNLLHSLLFSDKYAIKKGQVIANHAPV